MMNARPTIALASLTALVAVLPLLGCDGSPGEPLPGHSRPPLEHGWPHPADYEFDSSNFAPPQPAESFISTASGVRAYVIAAPSDLLVRISAALPLGRLYERQGEAGASARLTQLIVNGGPNDAQNELSRRFASLGTHLVLEEGLDVTRLSLEVLAEDWRDGLSLMIDLLRRPELNETVAGYQTGPGYSVPTSSVAGNGFRPKVEMEKLFGGYPLSPPDPGTSVSSGAVRALAERTLRADLVVLGIGGNVSPRDAEAALEELTVGWEKATELPKPATPQQRAEPRASLHTIDMPTLEGWIAIGRAIGPLSDSEQAVMAVTSEILGVRLNIAVREIRGLANRAIVVKPETASGAGLLHVRTGGRPEAVAPLIRFSIEEMERIRSSEAPITPEELESAKGWLVFGEWQSALESARQASATYAVETVRHGGTDRLLNWPAAVRAVTADQVKEMAAEIFDTEQMAVVVVGPLAKIRAARHPRWPIAF